MAYFEAIFFSNGLFSAHGQGRACNYEGRGLAAEALGGRAAAGGGGRAGGSDRIGNDLTKIDFLMKNAVLGQFLAIFGPSRPQKWIQLEISVLKMVE